MEADAERRKGDEQMNVDTNLERNERWNLRCPACHAPLNEVDAMTLGQNIQLKGICTRCRTCIFAIRRAPGTSATLATSEQRILDRLDQAA